MKILPIAILVFVFCSVHARDVGLPVNGGDIKGTLLEVENDLSCAILIVAGSGPTDRDGNSAMLPGKNNSLRYLAEALQAKGIATLRYDKRGIGESLAENVTEQDLTFDMYVSDAASWINFLKEQGYKSVFILGHSEGSLISIVAASFSKITGVISISGSAKSAPNLLLDQLRASLPPNLYTTSEDIVEKLKNGEQTKEVPGALFSVFRPSVQPYLISWFKYDPVLEIDKLDIPVLVIHGTTDIQIPASDASMLSNSAKESRLVIIEGMNHVLKDVKNEPQAQLASYSNPELPINTKLIDTIEAFIDQQIEEPPTQSEKATIQPKKPY